MIAAVIATAAIAVVGAALVLMRRDSGDDVRAGSTIVARKADGAFAAGRFGSEPNGFNVTYRVEDRSGGDAVRYSTDKVWVRRPFESRLETWSGEPPGRKQLTVEVAAFGQLATGVVDQDRLITGVAPGVAASDVRPAAALADAIDRRLVAPRELRRVGGRVCQVYRAAGLFTEAVLQPATRREYADTCVDREGIVLEEVLFLGGEARHRRVAVEVSIGAPADDELFAVGEPTAPVKDGGGSVRRADPATRPQGEFWELDATPPGFERFGRFGVIPPQSENFRDPMREEFIVAGTSDVWTGGAGFVVVDQGGTLRGGAPFEIADDAERVRLGDLGRGEVIVSTLGSEVRTLLSGGRYLRVHGTLPVDDLIDIARSLRRTDGTGLTYL